MSTHFHIDMTLSLEHSIAFAFLSISVLAVSAVGQVPPMSIEHDVTVDSELSDRFTWRDSSNQPRVAVLAHNDIAPFNNSRGGALRQFKYQTPVGTRTANVTNYGNGGYAGFGYVVSHSSYPGAPGACIGMDDSPLGYQFAGTWVRVFEGRHHAIFRFTQNYQRYCPPDQVRTIPVTMDWILSTGRDNPVYAITWNVDQAGPNAPEGTFNDDSRAPYGELNIDGDGGTALDGVAWGDRYKFTTTTSPVLLNSDWTYNVVNTIPYVKEWINGPLEMVTNKKDATMGLVQTQTMSQQDAGGGRNPDYHDIHVLWNTTSATGNGYADCAYKMPCQNEWAYQADADSLDMGNNNARLTWGTQFGFIGPHTYNANDGTGAMPPGYPKKSYSVYVVLGTHTSLPVEAQVTQVETIQSLTLFTMTGSVVTTGPAGVTRPDNVTYAPAGYNHVYGALAFNASSNQLDANIAVGAGTLTKPLIIVGNYTAANPQILLNSVLLTADVDYFASLRPAANELWFTLNGNLTGANNRLVISQPGSPAAPTGLSTSTINSGRIDLNWNAVGGATYQVDRKSPGGDYVQIAAPGTNSLSDTAGLNPNSAYIYRVRAVTMTGTSLNSSPRLGTTVLFTNNPIVAGLVVRAYDLAETRTAVNAVRVLAGLGSLGFTDVPAVGLSIKGIHVTELRDALDAARMPLGLSTGGYTDGPPLNGFVVNALHFQELRDRVK